MVIDSVLMLAGLGFALAALLAIASRLLYVKEDPRIQEITEALPGANCGGCGFAGCESYAIAVLNSPDVGANLCVVGGEDTAKQVGLLAGKAVEEGAQNVCFRRCAREEGNVQQRFDYIGASTCASAALIEGGPYRCGWSCLGLGDCVRACPFDAITIKNNMAEINDALCLSCGVCVKTCPRSILQIIPQQARVMSYCATREKLKLVSEVCEVGCINCLSCLKACPGGAIKYENLRIEIDHAKCLAYGESCNEACVAACSRKILRSRNKGTKQPIVLQPKELVEDSVNA
ncbi:RnfABCDGE type electron transport complex subunit B [Desulfovibrio litoralis]|uniref:Ion-translocating oxidoreductase complex subunit B n=1 Tax=Desulfovibrio litoralis DSM 11393 TaxID=1121455 RepID=A0A1M7SEF6_9BACT|nr:Fe-S cluster domain-containing protein [Desulfovibrio litoralis]SHN56879.1 electron transport complex protein RnfB [Desulfovibrio litoralis DSM 11393]